MSNDETVGGLMVTFCATHRAGATRQALMNVMLGALSCRQCHWTKLKDREDTGDISWYGTSTANEKLRISVDKVGAQSEIGDLP